MKFKVNDNCIACGLCASLCPEVFDLGDGDKAQAIDKDVDESSVDAAIDAMESCPVDAIEKED